eukprot:gnl/TRDRNA2_/TRDRNA2_127454_c0_seq1.p1 gnl/TRDRNA2_/TRDRNA2_127454_c0~~gnl/TRDRNA2_/TRDRNA2_127454_c0_seq1.p1  ORF type:complete len:328 (+),score=45.26 gnl/TRDRNA2_/TRDRNA2_127454_c0_seq1:943-1926(+)
MVTTLQSILAQCTGSVLVVTHHVPMQTITHGLLLTFGVQQLEQRIPLHGALTRFLARREKVEDPWMFQLAAPEADITHISCQFNDRSVFVSDAWLSVQTRPSSQADGKIPWKAVDRRDWTWDLNNDFTALAARAHSSTRPQNFNTRSMIAAFPNRTLDTRRVSGAPSEKVQPQAEEDDNAMASTEPCFADKDDFCFCNKCIRLRKHAKKTDIREQPPRTERSETCGLRKPSEKTEIKEQPPRSSTAGAAVGSLCEVIQKAILRSGADLQSTKLGYLYPGDVVEVLELASDFRVRVRCKLEGSEGWASLQREDGKRLLRQKSSCGNAL